jgi:hypothetical protein
MIQSPLPSAAFMDYYRIFSRVDEVDIRAANGEMARRYGQEYQTVPRTFGAMSYENLEPMAQLLFDWFANPVYDYFVAPSRKFLHLLPIYKDRKSDPDYDGGYVAKGTIAVFANTMVYVLVTLILVAPITIFNVVGSQTVRIAVMPLFCLLLIVSAQHMGSRSMPVAMLATT